MKNNKAHWENIYTHKSPEEVSWTQEKPQLTLAWIKALNLPKDAPIIDVGGGESHLVDYLLELGYQDLSVLDISAAALKRAQKRLGEKATAVQWIETDITVFQPQRSYALWHDRAVFHFLTDQKDIKTYTALVSANVKQYLLMSTFATNGPLKCSGLPITQYSKEALVDNFSAHFKLLQHADEMHTTPFNTTQAFTCALFQKSKS